MTTKIDGVKVEYTKNGNAYAVTHKGRNIGTAAGIAGAGALLAIPCDSYIGGTKKKVTLLKKLTDFVRGKYDETLSESAQKAKESGKNVNSFIKKTLAKLSKTGKLAVLGTVLTFTVIKAILIGRLIGKVIDKGKNHKNAKEADQMASELIKKQK